MGSIGHPGYEAFKADPASGVTSWTYGVPLCLMPGTGPAVLESVGPRSTLGSGFAFLGAGVREFTLTPEHTFIISTDPWPPPTSVVPDPMKAAPGLAVSGPPCSQYQNGSPYTELLIGLGWTSPDGGGWEGIEITYTVDGSRHVLVLDHDLMICGTSVDCGSPSTP